ncbi:MAG: ABC transporter ATP-binding protein [Alphaproteobacteria bacterium]|nr:ABC transporter ATP-binding protein [Alphaproteobacteria bacterium]
MLSIRGLTKRFPSPQGELLAVDRVDFDAAAGEFFTMLGPSGCGKTTTLRMIAGLESVSDGAIVFDGRDFARVPPQQRNIGMVFQSYALFPHLSVFENVAYGLRTRGMARPEIARRTDEVLRALQLDAFASRLPATLSGGQQQRVSIARALVYRPSMLLLDEPLANLDAKLRVQMREEIRRIQREFGILSLYVTHDQEEAMAISDRVALFNSGRLVQVGKPRDIYRRPATLFAADFIGQANFLPARLAGRDAAGAKLTLPGGTALVVRHAAALGAEEAVRVPPGADALVMARPERIGIGPAGAGLRGRVLRTQQLGGCLRCVVAAEAVPGEITVDSWHARGEPAEGAEVGLTLDAAECLAFLRPEATA